jgi:preprotein translocase subunit YajC
MVVGDIVQTKRGEVGKVLEVYEGGCQVHCDSGAKFTIKNDEVQKVGMVIDGKRTWMMEV